MNPQPDPQPNPATVRPAEPADLVAVAAIYAYFVRTSVATFDVEEPPLGHWQAKLDSKAPGDHFLVSCDSDDAVVGFAYSGAYRSRAAYDRTRETSVYVSPDAAGRGLATRLYSGLLELLRQDRVHLAVAVVTQPNPASNALHRRLGFTDGGTLDEVGYKFGRYLSTTCWQLRLT